MQDDGQDYHPEVTLMQPGLVELLFNEEESADIVGALLEARLKACMFPLAPSIAEDKNIISRLAKELLEGFIGQMDGGHVRISFPAAVWNRYQG